MRMNWSYYDKDNGLIPPLTYDNRKTQETIINEALEALDNHDVLFIQGGVGTGKSVIALHLIAHYKKGIIAVPTKALEDQYVQDYCGAGKNTIHTLQSEVLNVNYLRGRTNFTCPNPPGKARKPVDCGHSGLLCVRKPEEGETRASLAIGCPYWSPIYPAEKVPYEVKQSRALYAYESVSGIRYYCESRTPCPYYHQFTHFVTSGAIIMNSSKWEAETWLLRKPRVPVEVIDEGDAFLDGLAYKTSINQRVLGRLQREELMTREEYDRLEVEFFQLVNMYKGSREFPLESQPEIKSFIAYLVDLLAEAYVQSLTDVQMRLEVVERYSDYAWVQVVNEQGSKGLTFYIPRMDITLGELRGRSGKLVFMSATSHSDENFRNIFNVQPHRVYAQENNPGLLYIMNPSKGFLLDVNDSNWRKQWFREKYWELLKEQLHAAKKPCYVLVHANRYLPEEWKPLGEEMRERFWCREGLDEVYFSTKMDRGIDLRDDLCRSLVLLKYPIPYLGDVVLRTLRKQYGERAFWRYVLDMADRELLQQCGRAIRSRDDWCQVYSPDQNVVTNLERVWKGKIEKASYRSSIFSRNQFRRMG